MSMIGIAATIIAGVYLLATIVFQFRPFRSHFAGLDRLGILPRWRFFMQANGSSDHAVEWRFRCHDGRLGTWQSAWERARRHPWNWLWHPAQYREGIFWLAVETLDRRIARGKAADAASSIAYLTILNRCRWVARNASDVEAVQFALLQKRYGREESRWILYTSDFHPL
jgi:hypothetical protein